jgi:hypothetical protein
MKITKEKTAKTSPEIEALAALERKVAKMQEEIDALKQRPPTPPIFPQCPLPHCPNSQWKFIPCQQWPPNMTQPWPGYLNTTWI